MPLEIRHLHTPSDVDVKPDNCGTCSKKACEKGFVQLTRSYDKHALFSALWNWFLIEVREAHENSRPL
jgi:hypothetical protein